MARQKEWLRKSDLQAFAGSTTADKARASKLWTVLAGSMQEALTRNRRPLLEMRTITTPHKKWVPSDLTTNEYHGGMEVRADSLVGAYDAGHIHSGMAPGYQTAIHQLFVDWIEHLKQS